MQRSRASKSSRTSYAGPLSKAKPTVGPRSRINVTNFKSVTDSLYIPPEMNTILAAVGGEITIKLGPGSQSVQVTRDGAIIMTEPEVREISQINNFVKKERKSEVSTEKAGELENLAYRIIKTQKEVLKTWKPTLIGPNQLSALRDKDVQLINLGVNIALIEGNKHAASKDAKEYLLSVANRLRNAIADSALTIVGEAKTKDVYECAFERDVPRWAIVKLANAKLGNMDPSVDLNRLLFPKDFSKGITATVKELRSDSFMSMNAYVLQRSGILAACIKSDNFLKTLIGFDDKVDLNDTTNKEALNVMACVITLTPIDQDLGRLAKLLESRGTSMKWASRGAGGATKATILAFSHSVIKAMFGLVRGPDRFNSWWKLCFPTEFDDLVRKDFTGVNNTVGHWLAHTSRVKPANWVSLTTVGLEADRKYFIEAIQADLGGFSEGRLVTALSSVIGWKAASATAGPNGACIANSVEVAGHIDLEDTTRIARAMAETSASADAPDFKKIKEQYFAAGTGEGKLSTISGGKQKRGRRDPTTVARGVVTDEILALLNTMKDVVSTSTLEASISWVRGFSNAKVRYAAAEMLTARFDAYADEDPIDVEKNADYYSDSEEEEIEEQPAEAAVAE